MMPSTFLRISCSAPSVVSPCWNRSSSPAVLRALQFRSGLHGLRLLPLVMLMYLVAQQISRGDLAPSNPTGIDGMIFVVDLHVDLDHAPRVARPGQADVFTLPTTMPFSRTGAPWQIAAESPMKV